MNKKVIYNTLILFIITYTISNAQDRKLEKADDNFDSYAYVDAIESYEVLLTKGYNSEEIYKNLGNSNYFNANYEQASEWYSKLFAIEGATIEANYIYKYAQTLKSLEKYEESDQWMEKYTTANSLDKRASLFAKNTDYLAKIKENSGRYVIKNLASNSSVSDFAPSFYGAQLVFSTARDTGVVRRNTSLWNKSPFTNIFSADSSSNGEYTNARRFSKTINTKTHESSTVFTKNGSTVYFTRNNSKNRNFARDEEGVSRLKIYRATRQEDTWTNIYELPFNSNDYSVAHPALNHDETMLYFSSDMPGAIGESDIYSVTIGSDGSFGLPMNLGDKINTEGRETFPFITTANELYFASDGHPGLGGLDVYVAKLDDLDNIYVVNLGEPVNSEEDDFSYIINTTTGKGFFASNRTGGKGDDDIYSFIENTPLDLECNTLVAGIVKDQATGAPLEGANVSIYNSESEVVAETVSATDGTFNLEGDCKEGDYKLVANKDEYNTGNQIFATINGNDTNDVVVNLERTIKRAPVGADLAKHLNIEPIYFDLDKSFIRPDAEIILNELIEYLTLFPDMNIQVQSHTDVRGSTAYNISLSKRRAKETMAYLVTNGISQDRLTGEGYGETQLVNDCISSNVCSDVKHEENRRSEFIVVAKK